MAETIEKNIKNLMRRPGILPTGILGGKLPPQVLEAEEAVLGALMLEKEAISIVIEIIDSESFYKTEHQEIYAAIRSLFEKSQPIDIITVTNELRSKARLDLAGGAFYISELTNKVSSSANIEFHARLIAQKHILRRLIEISSGVQTEAYEETTDVFDLLDKAEKDLFSITEKNLRSSPDPMGRLISKAITQMEELKNSEEGTSGVPSGFAALDRITSGWQPSDLIILAARPGMGKTAFVLSMARNAAIDFKKPVAIFSLEMSALQLTQRLISAEAELDSKKLRTGNLEQHEWTQLNAKISSLSQANLFIDDTPALNIFELRAKCRRLKATQDIKMVIIDYLQLMSGAKDGRNQMNREQEISNISRSLKGLAKELNIPVIALSQLSRQVEQRGGSKRPQLSDLRESGSIEQDADQVMFIYRPEYYKLDQDENGNSTRGVADIIIAKNRHGGLSDVRLRFVENFAKFTDFEFYDSPVGFNDSAVQESPGPNFKSLTIRSKMNDDDEQENSGGGDVIPF